MMTGATLEISGPAEHAVFQRDEKGEAKIEVRVKTSGSARMRARLRQGHKAVKGFGWTELTLIDGVGTIKGVPTGGPYTFDIVQLGDKGDTLSSGSVGDLLVGDLWIMAGQSNMDGCGKLHNAEKPSRNVHAFYYDDRWDVAHQPLCWYAEATDVVHRPQDPDGRPIEELIQSARHWQETGAGPAVSFANAVHKTVGVPVGIVVCSHGGTSMSQWDPSRADEGGNSLYGSMLRRVNAVGGKVTGCIWYQGESDSTGEDAIEAFHNRFTDLIAAFRSDCGDPSMPFIYVQLASVFMGDFEIGWNRIQNTQLEIESEIDNTAVAVAIDSSLCDIIHIDSASAKRVGRRLARLAQILAYGDAELRRGPRPIRFEFDDEERKVLRVGYDQVNGRLQPTNHVWGFSAWDGDDRRPIATAIVDPDQPTDVVLTFEKPLPKNCDLWYGRGLNPSVNLIDGADMAAPVFGPVIV